MSTADSDLKARHRGMWASGDYPAMVETFLLPLGPRLVEACGLGPGMRVLDVAAGTGNASIPAAQRGAQVTASDLTPELLQAGAARAGDAALDWVTADAEALPFEDGSFDVVMSSIGVMFAPHHQRAADELVRVCRPGGTIGLLSWTPEGMTGALFRMMKPFAPPPPPGAQPPPMWGSEEHLRGLLGDRVDLHTVRRETLEITAFQRPRDYGEHFKARYGPAIAVRKNAEANGRAEEFDAALDAFCDEWNRGSEDAAEVGFREMELRRQEKLKGQMSAEELKNLDHNFRFLQLCDNLSLFVCLNEPGSNEHPWYKNGFLFKGERFEPVWEDRRTLHLEPNPFSEPFDLVAPYGVVERDRRLRESGYLELRVTC
ncbi:MAG TPA: DUF3891 family protein [Solirubrobacterales bacterium]|nr:DUF3891 family protein [Solirubrobacterales bacterium]